MISVQQAKAILNNSIPPSKLIELPLLEALNFCLAKDVFSEINMPPFRQSAMDGFALHLHQDLSYRILGEIKAGDSHLLELKPGEAVKIFTGAAVPDSANAVMQVEKTSISNEILVLKAKPFGHIVKSFKVEMPRINRDDNFVYEQTAKLLSDEYIINTFELGFK